MRHNTRVAGVGKRKKEKKEKKRKKGSGKAEKSLYSILLSGVKL
jgi:hypothetical protein